VGPAAACYNAPAEVRDAEQGGRRRGLSPLPFLVGMAVVAAFLSHPILGRLWHPAAGSVFAAPTKAQFRLALGERQPGANVVAYRRIGTTGVAVTQGAGGYVLWKAYLSPRPAGGSRVVLRRQSALTPASPKAPVSIAEVGNPKVLVVYVGSSQVAREEALAVVTWNQGPPSRVVLGGRPQAWILPPPPSSGKPDAWRSIVFLDAFHRVLLVVHPASFHWPAAPWPGAPAVYAMPHQPPW
jgi:hypothetical protein